MVFVVYCSAFLPSAPCPSYFTVTIICKKRKVLVIRFTEGEMFMKVKVFYNENGIALQEIIERFFEEYYLGNEAIS